jgi:ADP-dependent NAD(P)H-hydrate dehydratase
MSGPVDSGVLPGDGGARPSCQIVTPAMLRDWPLPEAGDSKYGRGQVLVVGGARGTPGAVLLAGLAALRVGAGRLSLAVAESVAAALAVAVPEAGVIALPETAEGSVLGTVPHLLEKAIARCDAVLIGSGLDDPEQSAELLRRLIPLLPPDIPVVLDAFALGVLPDVAEIKTCRNRVVLTPNQEEADRLLDARRGDAEADGEPGETDEGSAVARIAEEFGAVVTCQGWISEPAGARWRISTGHSGLGTSGSGDVLAGAITGLLARGATLAQATCWGTHLHAAAGDRLAARIGALGFLARELVDQLPLVMTELHA